jgi:hypothetical protein
MFRKLITMPVTSKMYNKRVFSSCNNRCNVDEVTNKLEIQEHYLEIINKKIRILTIMSFVNIMFSMIF